MGHEGYRFSLKELRERYPPVSFCHVNVFVVTIVTVFLESFDVEPLENTDIEWRLGAEATCTCRV